MLSCIGRMTYITAICHNGYADPNSSLDCSVQLRWKKRVVKSVKKPKNKIKMMEKSKFFV